jgi:Coenzyme PQQ synthesis protein D (PqqD)
VDGTTVLLDIKKGVLCRLNVVGSHIWLVITASAKGARLERVLNALQSRYPEVHYDRLQMDAIAYLEKLELMGLVHRGRFWE